MRQTQLLILTFPNVTGASVWPTLSARHRDYHWRLMTSEERAELRSFLPKMERRRLRERFVTNHQHARDNDRPYVLYKRLSKQELCELREQVRQANKQLVLSKMLKTPAQIEYEDQFLSKLAEMNDLNHQMVIVTIHGGCRSKGHACRPRECFCPRFSLVTDRLKYSAL